jgi:Allene oxide cyclase barrel like domain
MHKKLAISVIVALVLAVASITLASATAPPASVANTDNHGKVQVIQLVARTVQEAFLDIDRNQGPSLGDQIVFSDNLFRNGKKVGTDGGACTVTNVSKDLSKVTANCVATLSLRRGQITLQGLVTFTETGQPPPFFVAITGGTGAYRTAHGEMTVTAVSQTEERYTLHLIL